VVAELLTTLADAVAGTAGGAGTAAGAAKERPA
jgi:hypothetical protein